MRKLYGDGIHDDYWAIQERLDTLCPLVELPTPEKYYLISKTLKIHSYQELRLPRYCMIRLTDNANCVMLANADRENGNVHITVSGGIWDYNNLHQQANPLLHDISYLATDDKPMPLGLDPDIYWGWPMHFLRVDNLTVRDLTLKDPVTFACTLDTVKWFTVENIVFDFNHGNPYPVNMDGIHLNGNCHYGTIRNIKGATYDDLIALNSDEGSNGPITHIDIDGLYADRCQTFVRLLTKGNAVEHIHIRNLHGTCFMYGIGITKWYKGNTTGYYNGLVFDSIHISRAEPVVHPDYPRMGLDSFAMLSIESGTFVKSLTVSDMYRHESVLATPTVEVQKDCVIENLTLENCADWSELDFPFMKNDGVIKECHCRNIRTTTGRLWEEKGIAKEEIGKKPCIL